MISIPKPFRALTYDFILSGRFFDGEAVNGNLAQSSDSSSQWSGFLEVAAGGNSTLQGQFQAAWDAFISDLNIYFTNTKDKTPYILPRKAQALWFDFLSKGNLLTGVSGSQSLTTNAQSAIDNLFSAVANGNAATISHYNTLLTETITQMNAVNASLTNEDIALSL